MRLIHMTKIQMTFTKLEKADKAREEHLKQLQEDISKYDEHTGQKLLSPKLAVLLL